MKYSIFISVFVFLSLAFAGCEKVIDYQLADAKENIVIEAAISNQEDSLTVLVSKTSSYLGSTAGNPVSGAKVSLRIENKKAVHFEESQPGVYKLDGAFPVPGYWYILDVEYDGVVYSARSFMNSRVKIVDLQFNYFDGLGFVESGYKVTCFINDPEETENYYRIKYYINGQPVDDHGDLAIFSDKLINGKQVGLIQGSFVFQEMDTLSIELLTIDKAAYDYFSTLKTISGNGTFQTVSPSNPISNFNSGALGYFSIYTVDRKRIIVKDYLK